MPLSFPSHAQPEHVQLNLPEFRETGALGLFQLKRIFGKGQLNKKGLLDSTIREREWALDMMLCDKLKLGLEPTMQALYHYACYDEFEYWLMHKLGDNLHNTLVAELNELVIDFYAGEKKTKRAIPTGYPFCLSEQQLVHWQQHGYLVIPNVINQDLCRRARKLVYDFLEMDEAVPKSWYYGSDKMQKIMVQLFDHPLQEEIRSSTKIHAIFAALWQTNALYCSTDRMGFNPPETPNWQFPGPSVHWDLNFNKPISFGTQGLIYLSNVTKSQGAFCCVPGFHHKLASWLNSLPEGADPQCQDWSQWHIEPIAAKAGSLIVWHQALPHGSSPNRATSPRIVQYINMRPL